MKANIFSVTNQKGGTGKTTTAAALSQAARFRGFKALAIDLDPQGNLSFTLNAKMSSAGSYELLNGAPAAELIETTPQGVDIIPASWNLATLTSRKGSARRLQRALEPVKERYDFIFLDTPSTAGELQYNALQAATGLIIPLLVDTYNIQSLYQISDTARQIAQHNPELTLTGIILTQYDGRSNFTKQVRQTIIDRAAALNIPYLGTIRAGIAIKEAAGFQQSLYDYAPRSKPAEDYLQVFEAISGQGGRAEDHKRRIETRTEKERITGDGAQKGLFKHQHGQGIRHDHKRDGGAERAAGVHRGRGPRPEGKHADQRAQGG